ncbi:MAG: glycosyltransferase family 39 protein [Chloroflexota bacterium]
MKSLLVNRGFELYKEIWSDQPPVLTILLSWWFSLWGHTVSVARWLVVLLSAGLVWSLYQAARHATSVGSATLAVLLLLFTEYYLRLSGAVMVGLPSIALAMFAILLLQIRRQSLWGMIASGFVMGLAIQTKLMVALSIPALLLFLWFDNANETPTDRKWIEFGNWHKPALWLLSIGLTVLAVGATYQGLRVDLLFEPHFGTSTRFHEPFIVASSTFLPNFMTQQAPYLILAIIGSVWAIKNRAISALIPGIWLGTALVAFSIHRPLWYHHVLYLTVPLVWLCAYGIEAWIRAVGRISIRRDSPPSLVAFALLLLLGGAFTGIIVLYPKPIPSRVTEQFAFSQPYTTPVIVEKLIADSATLPSEQPNWLFTDRPYYAFLANRLTPPELAVISRKRLTTGTLTPQMMLDVLVTYQPEAILLERFTYDLSPELMGIIERDYRLILEIPPARYFRRSIID